MDSSDPQRVMLLEAKDAATKIAQAETDQEIIRAAIIMGLQRSISGFPVSNLVFVTPDEILSLIPHYAISNSLARTDQQQSSLHRLH